LEEVERFSTPGSVIQKKAYFEAHLIGKKESRYQDEQVRDSSFKQVDEAQEPRTQARTST
jgi:hypothetical protein